MVLGICLLAISIFFASIEVPKLRSKGSKGNAAVYLVLLGLGNLLVMLRVLGQPIPNPGDWMVLIMQPITKLLLSMGLIKA
ncbi:hypothetical protein GCM10008018_04770 [Paenibacillus marchantiophytorum]|uniref:Uncharacterized protein n=1 Tax=Paenibacillus marchantiophytorum TaxID=1619310 RepID=A0ABQ2BRH7_9BACL|nr:hypothetical protein [Paenibacillus marchantiophytorum]GGI43968.1 hypothetical protein GCM10008018_04770 [Paenibacillus marchantiophytorum]